MNYTFEQIINDIESGHEVRQNLSKIRASIKDKDAYDAFAVELKGKEHILLQCLASEDAKTRKNTALLLGDLADSITDTTLTDQIVEALFNGYESEEQLFVKSAYLTGLKNYDYHKYAAQIKSYLEQLNAYVPEESEKKHILEQTHALEDLLLSIGDQKRHEFTGFQVKSDLILTCNRKNVATVEEQIKEIPDIDPKYIKSFSAGILLRTDCIDQIQKIRTYQELLFRVPGMESLDCDVKKAAEQIIKSNLLAYLQERHSCDNADQPYVFRIEMKSKMDLATKSTFVKKLSAEIEQKSKRKLINNKSNYEIEIRLIETKNGTFNCLLKLYTLPDLRFDYRKESIAASIRPDNAALLVELAKEYMIPDARVLDPFCGVATLLIERQKVMKANTSYGIDIYSDAIEKAKVNTKLAGQIIHFINKDFFEFEHLYLFDEIFTDMPFETGHKSEDEIRDIYRKFFLKAKVHLTGNGRMILYTHHADLVKEYAKKANYKILDHIIILEKAHTDLFILQVE